MFHVTLLSKIYFQMLTISNAALKYTLFTGQHIFYSCLLYFFLDLPVLVRQIYSIYCSAMDRNFGSEFYLHD